MSEIFVGLREATPVCCEFFFHNSSFASKFVSDVEVVFAVGCAEELVLNEIVERKRMDDLACSITDRRFKEQKVNC